jgi:hypothetical protein
MGLTLCNSKLNYRISGYALSGLRFPLPASIATNSPPKSCPKKPATRRSPPGAGYKACLFPDVFRTAVQHWPGPANAARCLDGSSGSAGQFHRRAIRAASGPGSGWQLDAAQPGPLGLRASVANSSWRHSRGPVPAFLSPARLAHWSWTQIAAYLILPVKRWPEPFCTGA